MNLYTLSLPRVSENISAMFTVPSLIEDSLRRIGPAFGPVPSLIEDALRRLGPAFGPVPSLIKDSLRRLGPDVGT